MIVTFKKSYEKDLGKLRDADLLHKSQAIIEAAEAAVSLIDIKNLKKLKADWKLLSHQSHMLSLLCC